MLSEFLVNFSVDDFYSLYLPILIASLYILYWVLEIFLYLKKGVKFHAVRNIIVAAVMMVYVLLKKEISLVGEIAIFIAIIFAVVQIFILKRIEKNKENAL